MRQTPVDYVDRFGFTRHHELLSSSTTTAAAPLALVSAPQATFEVTTLVDVVDANDGVLSLREAITLANDNPGRDTITFAPSLFGGSTVLNAAQPLVITDDLLIDGDPLDRGAGGIVISGEPEWGLQSSGASFEVSPFQLNGGSTEITVSFEDLSIKDFDFAKHGISGDQAAVDLLRSAVQGIYGAAGVATDGPVTLTDSSVSSVNIGPFGGAWGVSSQTAISLVDSSISGIGGDVGFGLTAPEVSILRSTIDQVGGGYAAEGVSGGRISIVDSTISNINGSYEGGVGVDGTTVSIVNSTIANTSFVDAAIRGDEVSLTNSTVFNNPIGVEGEFVRINNSILLANGDDGQSDLAAGTTITSNGHNIFGSYVVPGAEPGDVLGADPALVFATGALADNGGPTQTIALLDSVSNPAIDGGRNVDAVVGIFGSPLLFDQRGIGFPRISEGSVDIGAFEFQGPFDRGLVVTTLEDEAVANGAVSLREAILTANETPGEDSITFAEEIRGGTIVLLENRPLVITDDLRIDGDPLDRGAGGIVIAGAPIDPDLFFDLGSAFVVRGGATEVTATFEDLSIDRLFAGDAAIRGDNAAINLVRSSLSDIGGSSFGAGVIADGFVSVVESRIEYVGGNYGGGAGILSGTGISLIDSTLSNFQTDEGAEGLIAPEVSMLRSSLDGVRGDYFAIGVRGTNISIVDSTISGVSAAFDPAEVISGENIEIVNSTIANNGGAAIDGNAVRIVNSTIAKNDDFIGEYAVTGGNVQISNSIFLENGLDGRSDIAPGTTITSNGHNVFGQLAIDGAAAGDVLGAEARLVFASGNLTDNGGPTQTIALRNSPLNPALDAADPADAPAFEQRGFPRDATPDIGAFELGPTTLPPLAEGVRVPDAAINGVPRSALTLGGGGTRRSASSTSMPASRTASASTWWERMGKSSSHAGCSSGPSTPCRTTTSTPRSVLAAGRRRRARRYC